MYLAKVKPKIYKAKLSWHQCVRCGIKLQRMCREDMCNWQVKVADKEKI